MSSFITLDKDVEYEYICILYSRTNTAWYVIQQSLPYQTLRVAYEMGLEAVERAITKIGGEFCFTIKWQVKK